MTAFNRPWSWGITWLVLLALPLPLVLLLQVSLVDSWQALIGYSLGVMAYVWWLVILVLASRPKWLDRRIGLPSVYQMHGVLALLALVVATCHSYLSFTWHEIIYWTGQLAWYLAIFGVVFATLFMSGWLVDRYPIAAAFKRRGERWLRHELKVWIHRAHFLAIGLVAVHVHVIPRLRVSPWFILAFDLYTLLAVGIFAWAKLVAPSAPERAGEIIQVVRLNESTLRLDVSLPEDAPRFEPGDFYWLRIMDPRLRAQAHPFSVTGMPEAGERSVSFTIRELGDYTRMLSGVVVGTQVRLEGPFGRFNRIMASDPATRPTVLIGLGTGLAPLLGLAKSYAGTRPLWVLHSSRDRDGLYARELQELADRHETLTYHRSQRRYSGTDLAGLIGPSLRVARYFVVGPAAGVVGVTKTLQALGVSASSITHERLTM